MPEGIMSIKINSIDENKVYVSYLYWLDQGYALKKAHTRKQYFLFGQKKYYIEMKQGEIIYKKAIQEAINDQKFELAGKLTKEYEIAKILEFNQ